MQKISKISGFPEFLPEQQQHFQQLLDQIKTIFISFGAEAIETPIVEKLEYLLKKGGDAKEIYCLRRVQGEDESSKDLGLKFDLTVPFARYVAQHFHELTFPFRRYQIQPVWRGERAQRGRYRQFYQCDFDIIGNKTLSQLYDFEILMLVVTILKQLDLGNFTISFNHRRILQELLLKLGVVTENLDEVIKLIDKKHKLSKENFKKNLSNYLKPVKINKFLNLLEEQTTEQQLKQLAEFKLAQEPIREIEKIYQYIGNDNKKYFKFDLSIARGLNYYTGLVFEVQLEKHPGLGSVVGGGRYDDLASQFCKHKLPGVGFSIGISRLFDAVSKQLTSRTQPKLLIAFMGESYLADYWKIATQLRKLGINVELFLEAKKINNQLTYATKKGFRWILFYGEEEQKTQQITIKDLEQRKQQLLKLTYLENYFKNFSKNSFKGFKAK